MSGGATHRRIDQLRRLRPGDAIRRREEFAHRAWSGVARCLPAKLAVLNYHRIGTAIADPARLTVSPENFERQLHEFTSTGNVVHLASELARPRLSRAMGNRRYAITFDDGYLDTLDVALPILERYGAPATVFISTGFVDQPTFWWDRVAELTLDDSCEIGDVAEVAVSMGILSPTWSAHTTEATRNDLHDGVYVQIAPLDRPVIDETLRQFADRLGNRAPSASRPMTTEELVTLAAHPLVTIGAHTVSHPKLPTLTVAAALAEIVECQNELDRILGPGERLLAYPHGATNVATARQARRAGFRNALTTEDRRVSPLDHPFRIPRVHANDHAPDLSERSDAGAHSPAH